MGFQINRIQIAKGLLYIQYIRMVCSGKLRMLVHTYIHKGELRKNASTLRLLEVNCNTHIKRNSHFQYCT